MSVFEIEELFAPVEEMSFERLAAMQHGAAWADVLAKAKRLVQDGKVTIVYNSPHYVMSHVIGDGTDNGGVPDEHDVEISRHDPASQIIEQWNCFLPDAPVTMADGSTKPISEVQPGEFVLTHTGAAREVLASIPRQFDGDLVRAKLSGIHEEVVATADHRFWVADQNIHLKRLTPSGRWKNTGSTAIVEETTGWSPIGELMRGEYFTAAFPDGEHPVFITCVGTTKVRNSVTGRFESGLDSGIWEIDQDLAYLLGWYIAEGCLIKSDKHRVSFTLHVDEIEIVERLSAICVEKFGTPGAIRFPKGTNVIDFRVSSYAFAQICRDLVGTGSRTKRLSERLIFLPKDLQEILIDAWRGGDGHRESNGLDCISTACIDLARQARVILGRLGHSSSFEKVEKNDGGLVSTQGAGPLYKVSWREEGASYARPERWFDQERELSLYRINTLTREPYKGVVYDLSVDEDHSFQVYGVIAHNCDCAWAQFAFDRTRAWKKYEQRPCWFPGQMVQMADGSYCAIEDVPVGAYVRTSSGTGEVVATYPNHYDLGDLVSIYRVGTCEPMVVTADHRVIVCSPEVNGSSAGTKWKQTVEWLKDPSHWKEVRAGDLSPDDWVYVAYPHEIVDFGLDVASLSPHLLVDGERVYKSVYEDNSSKVLHHNTLSQPDSLPILSLDDQEGFWHKVDKTSDCWIWNGPIDINTGHLKYRASGGQLQNARKLAWMFSGHEKQVGARIKPQCSSPRCLRPEHMKVKTRTTIGKRVQGTLPVHLDASDSLMTLVGYYLAEGSLEGNEGIVVWSLHRQEEWIADEIEEALAELDAGKLKRYRPSDRPNSLICKVSNSVLAIVLKYLCGLGSKNKRLAGELMVAPHEAQKKLLDCYIKGDGSDLPDGSQQASTSSDVLARQLVLLGARLHEYIPVRSKTANTGGPKNRDTEGLMLNKIPFNRGHMQGRVRMIDGYYAARISRVEHRDYEGPVYNMTVLPQHTVAVEDICCPQCSHVLATYWKSRSTPLDLEGYGEDYKVGPGQKVGPAGQQILPGMTPDDLKAEQDKQAQQPETLPDEGALPAGEAPPPTQAPLAEGPPPSNYDLAVPKQPQSPYTTPKQPAKPEYEQLHLFDVTAPPGFQPTPMAAPVSIPGGAPPTPGNPVQFPGTFSHFIPILRLNASQIIYATDAMTDWFSSMRMASRPIFVTLRNTVALEQSGGKIPIPGAMPHGISSEGVPLYHVMELGYNPSTGKRENADVNQLQGAPEQTGVYTEAGPGRRAEVIDWDESLKMAYIVVPLDYSDGSDARLHPHSLCGWVDFKDISPAPQAKTPWRRR